MGGKTGRPVRRAFSVLATLATMVLAGCGVLGGDPGMEHIHALDVDPADGTLYAASHHGVFRIPAGAEPQRVGSIAHDTMGFVILGPRHFLGSGHPASDEAGPANLGVLESTDAGVNWETVGLSGQADLHSIDVAQGVIVGHDSQTRQIIVSADRRTWERRSRLELADLAVLPTLPDFLVATTATGLVHSADGGRTFIPVPSAPTLQLVDWPAENALIGVSPNGVVGTSSDHGATWFKRGTVEGTPAALATNGTQEVYVATDRGIYLSKDGGQTFSLFYAMAAENS